MLAAEPWGILSKGVSPEKNIHVLPRCNSQRTGPVPVKMQLGGGCTSVIQFLCLLLRAVSHPNRDQDNNSPQTMKSYQYNTSTEENGPSGCMQESNPCGKSMQLKQTSSKGRWVSCCFLYPESVMGKIYKNLSHSFDYQTCCESQGSPWPLLGSPALCSALVRHPGVLCPALGSQDERHMDILEGVQQKATRTTKGLEHLS